MRTFRPGAPGTNQLAGFVELRPPTRWEKDNLKYRDWAPLIFCTERDLQIYIGKISTKTKLFQYEWNYTQALDYIDYSFQIIVLTPLLKWPTTMHGTQLPIFRQLLPFFCWCWMFYFSECSNVKMDFVFLIFSVSIIRYFRSVYSPQFRAISFNIVCVGTSIAGNLNFWCYLAVVSFLASMFLSPSKW